MTGASRDDRVPDPSAIAADHEPWGDRSAVIRIGSIAIGLGGLDDRLHGLVERNYAGFLAAPGSAPSAAPIGVAVGRAGTSHYLDLGRGRGPAEEARVGTRGTATGLDIWSYFFAGSFGRDVASGRLLLCAAGDHDTAQAVENYLRFLVSAAALGRGGFLLHSSGVVRDGAAYLFFGPSGAGKSTTVANSPSDWPRLGDDLVLVERDAAGYRACGVPFRGSFEGLGPNDPGSAPVALACRLIKDKVNRLETASTVVQVAEVLGEMPFLMDDPDVRSTAAAHVERFVRTVPVRRLHLVRDGSFRDVLPRP